jgi:hypothetical protein
MAPEAARSAPRRVRQRQSRALHQLLLPLLLVSVLPAALAAVCDPATVSSVIHAGFDLTDVAVPTDSTAAAVEVQACAGSYSPGNSWQTPLLLACNTGGVYEVLSGDATCEVMPCNVPRFDNGAEESFEYLAGDGTDDAATTALRVRVRFVVAAVLSLQAVVVGLTLVVVAEVTVGVGHGFLLHFIGGGGSGRCWHRGEGRRGAHHLTLVPDLDSASTPGISP